MPRRFKAARLVPQGQLLLLQFRRHPNPCQISCNGFEYIRMNNRSEVSDIVLHPYCRDCGLKHSISEESKNQINNCVERFGRYEKSMKSPEFVQASDLVASDHLSSVFSEFFESRHLAVEPQLERSSSSPPEALVGGLDAEGRSRLRRILSGRGVAWPVH